MAKLAHDKDLTDRKYQNMKKDRAGTSKRSNGFATAEAKVFKEMAEAPDGRAVIKGKHRFAVVDRLCWYGFVEYEMNLPEKFDTSKKAGLLDADSLTVFQSRLGEQFFARLATEREAAKVDREAKAVEKAEAKATRAKAKAEKLAAATAEAMKEVDAEVAADDAKAAEAEEIEPSFITRDAEGNISIQA